jgi:glutaredoxin
MWRPRCPFCISLRRGLRRAGIATVEHNIWSSPEAAARVRTATGGDETVPTVFIGGRSLVNPSVPQVLDTIAQVFPGFVPPAPEARGWARLLRRFAARA